MIFIAEDNPELYIKVNNYSELEEKIKELGNPNYDYEVVIEPSFEKPWIAGKIKAIKKSLDYYTLFKI